MRLHCEACARDFDSEDREPRCPICLRRSTVLDPRKPRVRGLEPVAPARPFLPRFAAAFVSCSLLFFALTYTTPLFSSQIPDTLGWRIYAALLGGLLLSLPITLVQMPGMFAPFGPRPPSRTGKDRPDPG